MYFFESNSETRVCGSEMHLLLITNEVFANVCSLQIRLSSSVTYYVCVCVCSSHLGKDKRAISTIKSQEILNILSLKKSKNILKEFT